MTVLNIGGAGLIGKHVTEQIAGGGESVVCADVDTTVEFDSENVVVEQCDVTDSDRLSDLIEEYSPDTVIDLAYIIGRDVRENPVQALQVNCLGMENVFQSAMEHDVNRVVWASTIGVYGSQELYPDGETVTEESVPPAAYAARPDITYYSAMKHLNEYQASLYNDESDLEIHTIRPCPVFGPRRRSGFQWLSNLVENAVNGIETQIPYRPDEVFPLIYTVDVARLFALIATAESPQHTVYNTGGHFVTIRELAELVEEETGGTVTWDEDGNELTMVTHLSNERPTQEFDFQLTPLREAVRDYVATVS